MSKAKQNQKFHHIKKEERLEIAILLNKGYKLSEIAKSLDRSPNTISYEVKNNSVKGKYNPQKANHKAYVKRKYCKFQIMKIVKNDDLEKYIIEKLEKGWTPELISGRIKEIDKNIAPASYPIIYKFIKKRYSSRYEKIRGKKKKKRGRSKLKKLQDRVFINERSKNIDNRRVYGHWEGDFIESGRKGKGSLIVLLERKTRFVLIKKITKRDTKTVNSAIAEMLFNQYCLSLTLDNDISFQKHRELSEKLNIPIYFCNPYHSWEKGGVENINSLIRKYIPKGSDISQCSGRKIKEIQDKLNNTPKKCLRFKTPLEIMKEKKFFEDEKKEN